MPEPYKFPEFPTETFNPEVCVVRLDDGTSVQITEPCEGSNYITFIIKDGQVLSCFALTIDDNGCFIVIDEGGKVTSLKAIVGLVMTAVLGTERYSRISQLIASKIALPTKPEEG